ncbi:MAG: N-acetylglucosamine-6-phosphate deacetylase [Oscillospiraceae bacterium]|nr:N-acetylglucosamine-6-phosphate deacetylase [Oscillospiraceae bacterium]
MKKALLNAKVILPDRIIKEGGIEIENGNIVRVFEKDGCDPSITDKMDCMGLYLAPGFIDIHLHGGGGADFMDGTENSVNTILRTHAKYGTTAFLPTTLSGAPEVAINSLNTIEKVQKSRKSGPKILGSHLEGNFFSMECKGAQNPKYIFPPTKENYERIVSSVSNIRMISAAPEVENALEFAQDMCSRGIVMSCAHSNATYEEAVSGFESGFSHITHIYNGNSLIGSPFYYCHIGVSEASLLFDNVTVEVISDGKHLPKELLRLIYKIKGPDFMNLCTDSVSPTDMPQGEYDMGGLKAVVDDGVAFLADRSTFAGSVCTGDRAVRTAFEAGIPLHDAVKMMTATPAKLLGVYGRIGSIAAGKAADVNLFDENVNIKYTLIDGEAYNDYL